MAQQGEGNAVDGALPRGAEGVHHVDENDFQNMKLYIGALGKPSIFEVSLSDNLEEGTRNIDIRTRQNIDPAPDNVAQAQAQAQSQAPAQGNAAPEHAAGAANQVAEQQAAQPPPQRCLKITVAAEQDSDEEEEYEYLDKMRGWLMAVATLFVNMAFQAVLHPPDWLKTEWYFFGSLPNRGSKAGAPLAAPAPSSPDVADVPSSGEVWRALFYLASNVFTFGTALTLAQVLLWETSYPQRTMNSVRLMMVLLSLSLACTFALGTSNNLAVPLIVLGTVVLYAVVAVLGVLGKINKATHVVLGCLGKLIRLCFVKLLGLCSDNLWPFRRAAPPPQDNHDA